MQVTLISTTGCDLCEHAHRILDRLSDEYPISVRIVELATSEGQRLAERGGIMFPPGLFLGDEAFSYGRVSERRLRRELDHQLGRIR
jgi:glutaredoxin